MIARELAKYKLDSVGVQEVRWDRCGSGPADGYVFLYRLRVLEKRVLRKIFGPKREEVGWRK
jgi:hypothetical protein